MNSKKLLLICSLMFVGAISFAQGRVITGTVTNAQGFVFPGVDVIVKGSTGGTTTGENGKYSIYTNSGTAILVFTYPGCEIKQVTVGNQTVKDVVLNCDIEPLRKKEPLPVTDIKTVTLKPLKK